MTPMKVNVSMPYLTQAAAEFWNTIANVVLVVGAILVMTGTWSAFWTGNMKEFYSNERIAANEAKTAVANADAARANERTAALESEAATAKAEQERLKVKSLELEIEIARIGPRRLSSDEIRNIAESISSESFRPLVVVDTASDPESMRFAEELANAIHKGGLTVTLGDKIIAGAPEGLNISDRTGVLKRALDRAGLSAFGRPAEPDAGLVRLTVGQKSAR